MKKYRIQPGQKVHLTQYDPADRSAFAGGKGKARRMHDELRARLVDLQEILYAQHAHSVLIVLQAMDTGGKDSTIRSIFEGVNPQGVRVACFKVPTEKELDHDFLWRIHRHTPAKGEIVIFNRSHYEDVLVPAVTRRVPEEVIERRYEHINSFEKLLAEEGTTILKFFLNIDKDEQKRRLEERLSDPKKHWKFRREDLADRLRWEQYLKAYEKLLRRTSTSQAPWYVIPANTKWYRNLIVSRIIVQALERLRLRYPAPEEGLDEITIP